jgi:hypothetical protein
LRYKAELFDLSGRKIGELPYREDYGNIFYISPDGEKVVNTGCYDAQFTGIYLIFSKEGKLLDRFKIDEWQECINHAFSENSKFFCDSQTNMGPEKGDSYFIRTFLL